MELDYSVSFAEQYEIEPQEYVDVAVTSLPFSNRLINRFRSNQIQSVADLSLKTPDELMQIKGLGKNSLEEIETFFSSIRTQISHGHSQNNSLSNLIYKFKTQIFTGNFDFVEKDFLTEQDKCAAFRIRDAYEILGAELVEKCASNSDSIKNIVSMLKKFYSVTPKLSELNNLINNIPIYRCQNQALCYINAYTQDENKRKILASQYISKDASLDQLAGNGLDNQLTYTLVKRFLKWCAFDLTEDVTTLMSAIAEQKKLLTIIEMRARKFTLEKCGNKLHITRERVRQLESKALRIFARYQSRIKLIAKISAEKNGASIITPADIERYSGDYSTELLFLLRTYKRGTYIYDDQLDVFIVGDDSLRNRVYAYIETLPEIFPRKKLSNYLETAEEENDLPGTMVEMAIAETYKLTGEVYHRNRLSLAAIYTTILRDHYPDGIKAYDPVEINHFRELVKATYGDVNLPDNDRALTARIAGICILCGRGIYRLKQKQYIPQALADKIYNYIVTSDNEIFLMNTLYSVFETNLREEGVDNKYFLQGILHELYGDKLVFTRDYVSKNGGETSIYSSVVNFIQQSRYPVSKKQIQEKFPGISDIVVNFSVSNPNVLNYFGEYLHTSKLQIAPEEERYLDRVVQRICADGVAHHIKDFYEIINREKPEILTRNAALYPFSAFSVLEYLFRDSYQFSRPYIAMSGVEIGRPAERLHDMLYSLDEFSFDDISDFTKENHFNIQSQLEYVNSCNDKFLIVNGTNVQSIEKIGITESIAVNLEKVIADEARTTMPIRELTCWASFPIINVPWTEWLVYSVLNKWGTQVSVAPSSNQFRFSIPLVAPKGQLDVSNFTDAYKDFKQPDDISIIAPDDLDQIDDILTKMIGNNLLEDDLWD